jgi:arylformamidase
MKSTWIDISIPVTTTVTTWPTDPEFRLKKFASYEQGNPCDASEACMSVHTGTHIDAPLHFIKGGLPIGAWEPEITIGTCRVVEILNPIAITEEEVSGHDVQPNERIIFKTKNSSEKWWDKNFNENFIHISPKAATLLAKIKPLCIGIDYLSVGGPATGVETHQHLLGAGIWLIESLDLTKITPGNYDLIFMPVNFCDAEAAPGRALVRKQ